MNDNENIYINPNDDIESVVSRLNERAAGTVYLFVPSGARILQNIVDAYLLRDAAHANNQKVVLVTNDMMGKVFAERAGMEVTAGSSSKESGGTKSLGSTARVADIVSGPKPEAVLTGSSKSKPKKKRDARNKQKKSSSGADKKASGAAARFFRSYRNDRAQGDGFGSLKAFQKKEKSRSLWKPTVPKIIIVGLILAVVLAGVVFGKVLPRADVTVYPVRTNSSFTVEVLVDQNSQAVDQERGVIPGEILVAREEASQEFVASGLSDVNSKARGTITIYNEFSSDPQVFIPSRFQSEDGKTFWTTTNITVPGANIESGNTTPGRVQAEVVATEPGEEYNIGPSRFQMPALQGTPRYERIYAISETPMEGGKIGQATVVSPQDAESALGTLRARVNTKLQEFRNTLPEGFVLWDEAYNEEVTEEETSKEIGEPANNFTATLKVTARGIAFREVDLEKLLDQEIMSRLSDEQTILPASKEVTFVKPPVVDYEKGTVFATLQVRLDIIENLNTETFKGAIIDKDKKEIKQILQNFEGIERVEVRLWPFWVKHVPSKRERVEVTIFGK